MGKWMILLWVLLAVTVAVMVAGLGYIRLAPSDPTRWHVTPDVSENKVLQGGVKLLLDAGPDGLQRLDALAMATPRTRVLAGSVQSGMITYVTRSKVFGFPDYTTVQQNGDILKIHARLRFGRSDLGVNAARIQGWVNALGP